MTRRFLVLLVVSSLTGAVLAQMRQNPSPMVEHTRAHERLPQRDWTARKLTLSLGTLFLPERYRSGKLLVFFHGGAWLPEEAVSRRGDIAALSVHIPGSSDGYVSAFSNPQRFARLVAEAESKAGLSFRSIALGGFSAGCGAIRTILRDAEHYQRVRSVLAIDGIHTGYVNGTPGPLESALETRHLEIYARLARDAMAGHKQLLITHTEIFPGTFASTTETADWLVREIGANRKAVLRWGPRRTQQLSEVREGRLWIMGFAGNSAPDHVDQLHSLPEYLKHIHW
jgi:hypothetical protein